MKRYAIKFMTDKTMHDRVKRFADEKGFITAGAFARFAVLNYMRRNPLKRDRGEKIVDVRD